jgi:hypothetical protein
MSDIVNLRQARKARDRAEEKRRADENAARHGRTKAERLREAAEAERARRTLEAHRFEDEDGG